jgi:hypothetical protein
MYQCFNRIDTGIEIQSLLPAKLLNNPGLGKSVHFVL